jgi:hypothetical protein
MERAWQTLRGGGLPLAPDGTEAIPSVAELGRSALEAVASRPTGRRADALRAFLRAWETQWPSAFANTFAADASRISVWSSDGIDDVDRYLKLRRIAIERLSRIL